MPILGIARVADFDECLAEAFRAENGCWHSAMIHSTNIKRLSKAAKVMNTTIFVKNGPVLRWLRPQRRGLFNSYNSDANRGRTHLCKVVYKKEKMCN